MRICFVSEYFWPLVGGLEISTKRLATWFASEGHQVSVVTQQISDWTQYETQGMIEVFRLKSEGNDTFCHRAARRGLFSDADFICLFGTGHDPVAKHWYPIIEQKHTIRGIKLATEGPKTMSLDSSFYNAFDLVFCLNPFIKQEIVQMGVDINRCFIVKNGLNIVDWRNKLPSQGEARRQLNISPKSFVVSSVGRFVVIKRFPLLVKTFVNAFRTSNDVVLLLHGSDFGHHYGEESILRELIVKYHLWNIRIIPPSVNPQLTYRSSDIFIAMGVSEGASNVILEALASGCPVIASDIPGHRVFIQSGVEGLLLHDVSIKSVANAIRSLKQDKELLRKMSYNALKRAKTFDIHIAAETYLDPVRKLLKMVHYQ